MITILGCFRRAKQFNDAFNDALFDCFRMRTARCAARRNKRELNRTKLKFSAKQKDSIKKLWKSRNASLVFWDFYTAATGVFDERYVPDDLYYTSIDAFYNDRKGYQYLDNKCYYDMYFPDVKQPKTILKRINNYWIEGNHLISVEDAYRILKQYSKNVFIKQATNSEGGHGVIKQNFTDTSLETFTGLVKKIGKDIIIQEQVAQHSVLSGINPNAINTIRIMTWLDKEGKVDILSKVLRIGVGNSYVDNASSGGIVVGIDDAGYLKKYAYTKEGKRFSEHPSTNVAFEGIYIPGIEKATTLVKNRSYLFPHYRLISWDICIEQDGNPLLIEFNIHHGQLDFHQLCNGPLWGERTQEMLTEVYGNK